MEQENKSSLLDNYTKQLDEAFNMGVDAAIEIIETKRGDWYGMDEIISQLQQLKSKTQ